MKSETPKTQTTKRHKGCNKWRVCKHKSSLVNRPPVCGSAESLVGRNRQLFIPPAAYHKQWKAPTSNISAFNEQFKRI